jgi:mono/diheme cytochrome c family protein
MSTARPLVTLVTLAASPALCLALVAAQQTTGSGHSLQNARSPSVDRGAPGVNTASNNAQVRRGQYLVNGVAICSDCHTPHDDNGKPIEGQQLLGAPMALLPARAAADWPTLSPRIGGIPPGTDEQMVTLLTTGVWKDGRRLRAPMPQFRMTREDAAAIVAYLKSLPY